MRWAWPSILFLFFMDPLPDRIAKAMGGYLQHDATIVTVYALQTLGIPAIVQVQGVERDPAFVAPAVGS